MGTRHRLDRVDLENPKVRCPAMRLKHGIVIGAEMLRRALPVDGGVEHAAHVNSGDGSAIDADTDQTTRELVHDDEYPIPDFRFGRGTLPAAKTSRL
jgi:hypothetical protein